MSIIELAEEENGRKNIMRIPPPTHTHKKKSVCRTRGANSDQVVCQAVTFPTKLPHIADTGAPKMLHLNVFNGKTKKKNIARRVVVGGHRYNEVLRFLSCVQRNCKNERRKRVVCQDLN